MKQLVTFLFLLCAASASAQTLPYQNTQLSAAQRADDLIGRLTLEEKVSLMMDSSPAIPRLGIPQIQWWNEALHGVGRNGYATVLPLSSNSWRRSILFFSIVNRFFKFDDAKVLLYVEITPKPLAKD